MPWHAANDAHEARLDYLTSKRMHQRGDLPTESGVEVSQTHARTYVRNPCHTHYSDVWLRESG
jgi:hypothetical protein